MIQPDERESQEERRARYIALTVCWLLALWLMFLSACASPLEPDPCAKPASPKGCTPPTCAHPMCY